MDNTVNTFEEVVNLVIPANTKSGRIDITPRAGQIVRVKIFHNGLSNNPGIINASIEDDNSRELSRSQHIENYRDRSAGYLDCKPFYQAGGRRLWFRIDATANFTAEFRAQLILIYTDTGTIINDNC